MTPRRFLIIDDDPINNMICRMTIDIIQPTAQVIAMTNGSLGLEFIRHEYVEQSASIPTFILLDINMPEMNGWEFLERFHDLPPHVKELFTIYILTSSIDERDKQRSYNNKNVTAFVVKPLVTTDVEQMVQNKT